MNIKMQQNKNSLDKDPTDTIVVVGDTHGDWSNLERKIEYNGVKDCTIIHVGDIGVGFMPSILETNLMKQLDLFFRQKNIVFKAIRGNHDDPAYFNGQVTMKNFQLLPDYHEEIIRGESWRFIGGGVSVDRASRDEYFDWWRGEEIIERECDYIDNIVIHVPPTLAIDVFDFKNIQHFIEDEASQGRNLVKLLTNERKVVDNLCSKALKNVFSGHMHSSVSNRINEINYRCLNILEFFDYKK